MPRRTIYYKRTEKPPVVQERFAATITQLIEESLLWLPYGGVSAALQQRHGLWVQCAVQPAVLLCTTGSRGRGEAICNVPAIEVCIHLK